jgi:hypothetical protein
LANEVEIIAEKKVGEKLGRNGNKKRGILGMGGKWGINWEFGNNQLGIK